MLKRFWIAAVIIALVVLLAPPQANAQVRFGVSIGQPGYYSYPTYSYYPYYQTYDPYYVYPYTYRYPAYTRYYVDPGRTYTWTLRSGRSRYERREHREKHRDRH